MDYNNINRQSNEIETGTLEYCRNLMMSYTLILFIPLLKFI